MNVALHQRMGVEEFLAWEERQERPWEFDGFRPVAMTGGTIAHSAVQSNLVRLVGNALVGSPCRVHAGHLKIRVADSIRYPDAFVACSGNDPRATVSTEPVVIFEVLSPSTNNEDLVVKNAEYRATPSVQRYVILEQTHAAAMVFSRQGDLWVSELLSAPDGILDMPEIGVSIPLAEIYADVALADEPSEDET